MKTTIKTAACEITIGPSVHPGDLCLTIKTPSQSISTGITPDQAGALLFGLEMAMEAIEQRAARKVFYMDDLTTRERFEAECG